MTTYIYLGDKYTDESIKGSYCTAVKDHRDKCIRGKNGSILVDFSGDKHIVIAKRLRKIK
jgi:hypothetical protein